MLISLSHRFLVIWIIISLFPTIIFSQNILSVSGKISGETLIHNGELPPLWLVALNGGRWHNFGENQSLVLASTLLQWSNEEGLNLNAGLEGDYSSGYKESYLHTVFFNIRWKNWQLTAGKHVFDPVFLHNNQSSGSYLYGDNYRPVPRVTIELADYTPVPFTQGLVEVRGGLSQGWLINQQYGGDVLLHEKYAYLRFNISNWQPYAGLNHSAQMGGKKASGSNIPVDFWATFFGQGSDKIGGGEATNAAGAHMGLYDFGTWLHTPKGNFHLYYQIPFSDGSGSLFWQGNTDHILGIDWRPTNISWLKNVTFEWIQTTFQSGNGMPDPGLPPEMTDDGYFRHFSKLTNQEMFELSKIDKENWTNEEIIDVLKREVNHGNDFGGRDGYMNNGMYPAGWSYNNYIMGHPFNLIDQQVMAVNPNLAFHHSVKIKNDRFKAIHLGSKGQIGPQIMWSTKITWTRNFGTYFEQYPGRYTWDEADDYWFKGGRDQWYTMLHLDWTPRSWQQVKISASLAYDHGEIYQSTGLIGGLSYTF
ncbi:capsule assembly Wzi family protein [Thermophagus sp. OGC60D27]|uniref:capsule assembly Wzi family protein n=1 Tax=Thermophagus sp. OGC60D27 TaxID=3458415 RepID=UPI0040381C0A